MRVKRFVVLLLAFMLVFSNSAYATGALTLKSNEDVQNQKPVNSKQKISKEELDETYKTTDEVRVIVQVAGEAAISYATQKGVKFADLSKSEQTSLQDKAFAKQNEVKQQITTNKINMNFEQEFATAFNGFSGLVEYGEIELIEKLPGVANVTISNEYERPEATPDMKYSGDMVEAQKTWDEYGYDGEGMIVGVIDSGVDPNHRDFVLTNEEKAQLKEDYVNGEIADNDLPGQYHTAKVPYGYNYMDESQEILDLGPEATMHGMHVAGTVGSNGDEDNGGLKGVAPEAQILALKVFGNDPDMGSTWGDIYIKAIDDSIILGADVLNMSLGSTAAFVDSDNPEQQAIQNAVDNGILMSISAGNSAHLGNGFFNPYVENPDIGVVGSPGLSYESLQVASIENTHIDMEAITYSYDEEEGKAPFLSQGNVDPGDIEQNEFELEYAGLGGEDDFDDADFTGKYALIQRGEHPFTEKAINAQEAGAAGAIIYNNEDGIISMATEDTIEIPQLFMFKSDGDKLAEELQEGIAVTIEFQGDEVTASNPEADHMSDFTSWGVTPNLDFKPEITAPGGSILSTFQNDEYGMMSGTSMAAPHVAGGSALVLQKVDEAFDLQGKDRVNMAKNILMNTATSVLDKGYVSETYKFDVPYSPRRQGSGLMKLHSAIKTPAVVTEANTDEAKVALKEVNDEFSFELTVTNSSDEEVTYDLDANVQTDLALQGVMGNLALTQAEGELEAVPLEGADISFNNDGNITVPAGSSETIEVTIDVSGATIFSAIGGELGDFSPEEVFPNGYFVEGFVTLTDPLDNNPELSVPYVGFNGDWDAPPVLDELAYDGNDSFYEEAALVYEKEDGFYYLGVGEFDAMRDTSKIAISPEGEQDHIIPVLSFLRNAKTVEYNILDEDGQQLRRIMSENNVRKNYFDGGSSPPYRLLSNIKWDGKVDGKVAQDGQYYFEIKTTIDYPGAEPQSLKVPVIVDSVPPTVSGSVDDNELNIESSDEGSGVQYLEVFVDGESLDTYAPDTTTVDLDGYTEGSEVMITAVDYAGNQTDHIVGDNDGPIIEMYVPETFEVISTSEVYVMGLVTDDNGIAEVTVEGRVVEDLVDFGGGTWLFETEVTFEDGTHPIRITATDVNGNTTKLANSRTVFVDTTPPLLDVEAPSYVENDVSEVDIRAHVADNAEELRLLINDDEVFYNEIPGNKMNPFSADVTATLSLEPGNNEFELELIDLAGHTAVETIEIYRATEGEDRVKRISGTDRFDTGVEISKEGWDQSDVVVLARSDDYADALAGVPLAAAYDAPVLLTRPNELMEVTKDEIKRLGAQTVYMLGGENALSEDVRQELRSMGITVERIAGEGRSETAALIAKKLTEGSSSEVVLVDGHNFPDALSVASYAADKGLPILLTQSEQLPIATQQVLYDLNVNKTLVIGGTVAISEDVVKKVPNPLRIKGDDRYHTAVKVAEYFDVTTDKYFVATGKDFADALTGAALAAKQGTGILLVKDSVTKELGDFIKDNNIDTIQVFGGTTAVNPEIVESLAKLLK